MITRVAPLPERPRRYRFALTPLADAMFQLLIFFMLSSSLTPYSLVTLRGVADTAPDTGSTSAIPEVEDENATTPASANRDGQQITIWTLGDGIVVVNDQIFERAQLPELAEAIGTQGVPGKILILVGEQARVQDVATAIEALDAAEVEAVQIARTPG